VYSLVPAFIEEAQVLDELSVIIGHSVDMHCRVSGVPEPIVSWHRDGERLTYLMHSNIRLEERNQRLTVSNAQLADIGVYRCIASNVAGNDSKEFLLNVQGLDFYYPHGFNVLTLLEARTKSHFIMYTLYNVLHKARPRLI